MQNNKSKKIIKNKQKKQQKQMLEGKKYTKKKEAFIQDNLMDLVSQSQEKMQQQQVIEANEGEGELQLQQGQSLNDKVIVNKQERLYLIEIDKHYKVKIGKDIKKYKVNALMAGQKIQINGKQLHQFYPQHSFIFKINREPPIKKNAQYLNNLSQDYITIIKQSSLEINFKKQTFLKANFQLFLQVSTQPWVNLPVCVDNNDSLMIIGGKNTGKSMLGEYILNVKGDCAFLDCDLGRNASLEGCVSISSNSETKKIWIGQLTPLNNLQTYLRAISYLFAFYRQNWYTKKIVINTMGYTTGLGEFLIYELYQIIKPKQILILSPPNHPPNNLTNIIRNLKSGQYLQKLYINKSPENIQFSSTEFYNYQNAHCSSKKGISRFQKNFQNDKKLVNICDLLEVIKASSNVFNKDKFLKESSRGNIAIYEQSKHGKSEIGGLEMVSFRKLSGEENVDMRLIILGRFVSCYEGNEAKNDEKNGLFQVIQLGFAFNNKIYSKGSIQSDIVGVVNQGMDFQKGFYHLNEKQLLQYQLKNGRLNYILVNQKCLGSKGVRNNPSKST